MYYSYWIFFGPAGGGGGPYAGNGAYYTSTVDQSIEDYTLRRGIEYQPGSTASFGCGGGGGVVQAQFVYFNNYFDVYTQDFKTGSRGGDGWVILEFFNDKPNYNPFTFGATGRFCDIRDLINPALRFANETHVLYKIPSVANRYNAKRTGKPDISGEIVVQVPYTKTPYTMLNTFIESLMSNIDTIKAELYPSGYVYRPYVLDNNNDCFINTGDKPNNYITYKPTQFLFRGELKDPNGGIIDCSPPNPARWIQLDAQSFYDSIETLYDGSGLLIYKEPILDLSGDPAVSVFVDPSGFSIYNQFETPLKLIGVPYLTQNPSVLSSAPLNKGYVLTPVLLSGERFDSNDTYLPSRYPYAFVNTYSERMIDGRNIYTITQLDNDLRMASLFYKRNTALNYPLIHVMARGIPGSNIGFQFSGSSRLDTGSRLFSYHPNYPFTFDSGDFNFAYIVKSSSNVSLNCTFLMVSMLIYSTKRMKSLYADMQVNVQDGLTRNYMIGQNTSTKQITNSLGISFLLAFEGSDVFNSGRVNPLNDKSLATYVQTKVIPAIRPTLDTVFRVM